MEAFKECKSSARRKSTYKKIFTVQSHNVYQKSKTFSNQSHCALNFILKADTWTAVRKGFLLVPARKKRVFPLLFLYLQQILFPKNNFTVRHWSFLEIFFAYFYLKATCNFFFPTRSLQLATPAWDNPLCHHVAQHLTSVNEDSKVLSAIILKIPNHNSSSLIKALTYVSWLPTEILYQNLYPNTATLTF